MPFLLYSTSAGPGSARTYRHLRNVPLAGNTNGLILKALEVAGVRDGPWILDAADLLSAGGYAPAEHALLLDAVPARKEELLVFEIVRVAGYTAADWTPIMLVLDTLLNHEVAPGKAEHSKAVISEPPGGRDRVHTFLYLRDTHEGGSWNWGRVGMVNGALLWPEAFDHFVSIASR